MNLLVDKLPTAIKVGDEVCKINYDYRSILQIVLALEDEELTGMEKAAVLLGNLYQKLPADRNLAVKKGLKFIACGDDSKGDEDALRLYSFNKDAELIFSAFRQTHGIDLETAKLHWWKFIALFMDLGADTAFCSLVALRKRLKTGKASKEEVRAASEIRELIDIPQPDTRTPEEIETERRFMDEIRQANERRRNNGKL